MQANNEVMSAEFDCKTSEIYDFCLDWQMQGEVMDVNKLIKSFEDLGVTFKDFKEVATANKWFVTSMNQLNKEYNNV